MENKPPTSQENIRTWPEVSLNARVVGKCCIFLFIIQTRVRLVQLLEEKL